MTNLVEGMASEIERVTILREQYKSLRGPGVNVEPAIMLMTESINAAKSALGDNDIGAMAGAYQALKGFQE